MIVDISKREFKASSEKVIWILFLLLTGFIGAMAYYFAVRRKDKTKSTKWFWILLVLLVVLYLVLEQVLFPFMEFKI